MAYCVVIDTKRHFVHSGHVVELLPAEYSYRNGSVEYSKNSVVVADVQLRGSGNIVFFPNTYDTTGTAIKFVRAFEEKNGVKFQEQSV